MPFVVKSSRILQYIADCSTITVIIVKWFF